ncbi:hypothetical protein KCP70_15545 [Salmonella enterica subsp. enterica]|nr:hypothetical protein KCP70_15545 [Salmonella enterica subsp. enterica]
MRLWGSRGYDYVSPPWHDRKSNGGKPGNTLAYINHGDKLCAVLESGDGTFNRLR